MRLQSLSVPVSLSLRFQVFWSGSLPLSDDVVGHLLLNDSVREWASQVASLVPEPAGGSNGRDLDGAWGHPGREVEGALAGENLDERALAAALLRWRGCLARAYARQPQAPAPLPLLLCLVGDQ